MRKSKVILFLIMILPWFTLPFLGEKALKKFLPSAIFISIVTKIIDIIAQKLKWWKFTTNIHPLFKGNTPLILGPFFVTTFWSLKKYYGKFLSYLMSNAILHVLFAYIGVRVLKLLGIVALVKMKSFQLVLVLMLRALLLYGFQFMKESREKRQGEGL